MNPTALTCLLKRSMIHLPAPKEHLRAIAHPVRVEHPDKTVHLVGVALRPVQLHRRSPLALKICCVSTCRLPIVNFLRCVIWKKREAIAAVVVAVVGDECQHGVGCIPAPCFCIKRIKKMPPKREAPSLRGSKQRLQNHPLVSCK